MRSNRLRLLDGPPILRWDGRALHGLATSKAVVVAVPARYVSFRIEDLPPAAEPALKAAARMKAERAFAPLGAVAIEALLPPARNGRVAALMLALPKGTIDAIRATALTQGHVVASIKVAELLEPVPTGGVVTVAGEACLLALDLAHGKASLRGIAILGPAAAPGFAALLVRERLRLGVAEDAPAAAAVGAQLDFLHPTLAAPPALLTRPGVRLGLLTAGVVLAVIAALGLAVHDALAARTEALAAAERLRPLASALAARRADLKEVAGWLDERPSLAPGLHVLAQALPGGGSDEQVRLTRVRQTLGEETVAEGTAGDRAQMLGYLDRLRRDHRVSFAEIRASRSPSKESRAVVFELVLRLAWAGDATRADGAADAAGAAAAPAAPPAEVSRRAATGGRHASA
jgi:hypothetical protein